MIIENLSKTISEFVDDLNLFHNAVYISYIDNEDFFVCIKDDSIYINISLSELNDNVSKYKNYSESRILFFMIAKQLFHILFNHINENIYLGNRDDIKKDKFNINLSKIAKDIEVNYMLPIGIKASDYNLDEGKNWTYYYEKLYDLSKNKSDNKNNDDLDNDQINNNEKKENDNKKEDFNNSINSSSVDLESDNNEISYNSDDAANYDIDIKSDKEQINIDYQDNNDFMIEKILKNYNDKYIKHNNELNTVIDEKENVNDELKCLHRGGGKGSSNFDVEIIKNKINKCNSNYFKISYNKVFEFFKNNVKEGLEEQNYKFGNTKQLSYFKYNNRTTLDTKFIIPGRIDSLADNFDTTNYTGIIVLIDFSGSTYDQNDLLNKLCLDILDFTEDIYVYDYNLRRQYSKEYLEPSGGGTDLGNVLNDLAKKIGKKIGKKRYYILTDGLDESIDYCIENYDMNIFDYGENQLEFSVYRNGKMIKNIKK